MKLINMVKPSKEPSSDIFTRRSLDLISSINNNATVALRPAILAALMGQSGLRNSMTAKTEQKYRD